MVEVATAVVFSPETLTPYGPNILVERFPEDDKTVGGLFLPDNALNKSLFCKVLKVGTGEYVNSTFVRPPCKPGDIVIVRQMDGRKMSVATRNTLFVPQELIEAVGSDEEWPAAVLELINSRIKQRLAIGA